MVDAVCFQLGCADVPAQPVWPSHTAFFDTGLAVDIHITIASISSYDVTTIAGERVRL